MKAFQKAGQWWHCLYSHHFVGRDRWVSEFLGNLFYRVKSRISKDIQRNPFTKRRYCNGCMEVLVSGRVEIT